MTVVIELPTNSQTVALATLNGLTARLIIYGEPLAPFWENDHVLHPHGEVQHTCIKDAMAGVTVENSHE